MGGGCGARRAGAGSRARWRRSRAQVRGRVWPVASVFGVACGPSPGAFAGSGSRVAGGIRVRGRVWSLNPSRGGRRGPRTRLQRPGLTRGHPELVCGCRALRAGVRAGATTPCRAARAMQVRGRMWLESWCVRGFGVACGRWHSCSGSRVVAESVTTRPIETPNLAARPGPDHRRPRTCVPGPGTDQKRPRTCVPGGATRPTTPRPDHRRPRTCVPGGATRPTTPRPDHRRPRTCQPRPAPPPEPAFRRGRQVLSGGRGVAASPPGLG